MGVSRLGESYERGDVSETELPTKGIELAESGWGDIERRGRGDVVMMVITGRLGRLGLGSGLAGSGYWRVRASILCCSSC